MCSKTDEVKASLSRIVPQRGACSEWILVLRVRSKSFFLLGSSMDTAWVADGERNRVFTGFVEVMTERRRGSSEERYSLRVQRDGGCVAEETRSDVRELFGALVQLVTAVRDEDLPRTVTFF